MENSLIIEVAQFRGKNKIDHPITTAKVLKTPEGYFKTLLGEKGSFIGKDMVSVKSYFRYMWGKWLDFKFLV